MQSTQQKLEDPALAKARQLLEQNKLDEAVTVLEALDSEEQAIAGLLGVVYFRLEQYGKAAQALRKVSDPALRQLFERADANQLADVARAVPEPLFFDRQPPAGEPRPGSHEQSAAPGELPKTKRQQIIDLYGNLTGKKFGLALGSLARVFGREPPSGSKWTSWYERGMAHSIVMLARRRQRLDREQLFAAYASGEATGFYQSKTTEPDWVLGARTADGSWNDLKEPLAGAANTRFGFNTDPWRTPPETGERMMTPNPRRVSRVLLTRKDGFKAIPFLNVIGAAWIQFMNHDWVSYGDPDLRAEPYRVPLDADDPARRTLHQTEMLVFPTQQDPTRRAGDAPSTHLNEVTSWWDASQLYGSDEATQHAVRSHVGGKLRIDEATGRLPLLPDGVVLTGFRRNWWLGLELLHTLFVKEHNAICDMLAVRYPHLGDQRLFDVARLINAAVLAKIHTVEWTPAVLPNATLNLAMNANWYGALTNVLREKKARKTLAEINIADPVAGGLVGNETDNHGVPYSLTREFLSVYRLHSLLPDKVAIYQLGKGDEPVITYGLAALRQAASHGIATSTPVADLFYSFGRQNAGQLVLNNYPETLQNLSVPRAGFYDLAAVDVLRDRERGTPRYNQFRRLMGLEPLGRMEELTNDVEALKALHSVYDSVDDVDLLVGNLAESHRPTNFGFGETLFEVFILNASRRLQADRFFTESYREQVYTAEGLRWIDDVSLREVLLRHYPELVGSGLTNLENAFEPWDEGELDPARHPLRQYDAELRAADYIARVRNREQAEPPPRVDATNAE